MERSEGVQRGRVPFRCEASKRLAGPELSAGLDPIGDWETRAEHARLGGRSEGASCPRKGKSPTRMAMLPPHDDPLSARLVDTGHPKKEGPQCPIPRNGTLTASFARFHPIRIWKSSESLPKLSLATTGAVIMRR